MASDGHATGQLEFKGFSLSLTAASDDEAERLFAALADGGTVQMPMAKTFFASKFGMVADPLRRRLDGDRGRVIAGRERPKRELRFR